MTVMAPSSNFVAALLPFLCVLVATPTFAQVCPPLSVPATSNADLNVFAGCVSITGDVVIGHRDCSVACHVTSLSPLSTVQDITGSLVIQCCAQLIDLIGPPALSLVRGSVVVYFNQNLNTISGFSALNTVQGSVEISQNLMLQNVTGLGNLREISGYLQIDRNVALTNLDGFRGLTTIGGSSLVAGHALSILYNTNLTELSGFRALADINFGTVHVEGNTALCYAGHPLWGFGSYPLREVDGGNLGIDWRTKLRSTSHWQYTWNVFAGGYPTLLVQNNAQGNLCASAASCDASCDTGAGCLGPGDAALCGSCLQEGSLDTCDFATQPTTPPTPVPLSVVYGVVFSVVGLVALAVLAVLVFCFVKLCSRWRETRKGSFNVDIGMQNTETSFTTADQSASIKRSSHAPRSDGNIASMAEPTSVGGTGGSRRKGKKKSGLDNVVVVSNYHQSSDYTDGGFTEKPQSASRAPPPQTSSRAPPSQTGSLEPAAKKTKKKSSEPVLVSSYHKTSSTVSVAGSPLAAAAATPTATPTSGTGHERGSSNTEPARAAAAADIPMTFPVAQLKLVREIGMAEFGKVFRAEARKLVVGQKKTTIMVKQLKEGATKQEKAAFIRPVEAMKLLQHPNVLSLLGVCMDGPSIMVMLEYCSQGNFKTYLMQKRQDAVAFKRNGQLHRSALDMATGLMYLHTRNIAHNDFAVRNCMVMGDGAVKLGDYGLTRQTFKEDYYSRAPNQKAWPVRWMAPEQIVIQGRSVLDSLPVSMQGNIWSFGVALWEVCSFAQWPYDDLSNEEVIQTVKVFGKCALEDPLKGDKQLAPLFDIMTVCWQEADLRPTMADIVSLLKTLKEGGTIDIATAAAAPVKARSSQADAKRRPGSQTSQTGPAQADTKKRAIAAHTTKGSTPAAAAPGQTSQTSLTGSTATRRLSDQYKPRRPAPKKPPNAKSSSSSSSSVGAKKKEEDDKRLLLTQSQPSQEEVDSSDKATRNLPQSTATSSSPAGGGRGAKKKKGKQFRQRTASSEPLVFENAGTSGFEEEEGEEEGMGGHDQDSKLEANRVQQNSGKKTKTHARYHFEEDFEDALRSSPNQLDLSLPDDDGEMMPFQMPPTSKLATASKDDFIIEPPEDFSQSSMDNEFDRQHKLQLAAAKQGISDEEEEEEEEEEGGFPLSMKKFGGLEDLAEERTNSADENDDDDGWEGYPVPGQDEFDGFDHRDALEEDDLPNVVYDEDVAALIW